MCVLIDKKQPGFNELRFVCLASDWTRHSNRPDLELIGIDVEISGIKGKISVASDGARIHMFHGLLDKVKIEPGYYWVRKVTKTKVKLEKYEGEAKYFNFLPNIMFDLSDEISLSSEHKSASLCQIILEMKRPFNLRFLGEAMGYQSGLQPKSFSYRLLRTEDNGEKVFMLKVRGDSWESYVANLRVKK